jgi:hypothetical protein
MPVRELVEFMLAITGKDEDRIRELLRCGTLVSGASRFRWEGWEADAGALRSLLQTFPDADPQRPFRASGCRQAVFRGSGRLIELTKEIGARRRLLRRRSFWDVLMAVAEEATPAYLDYSYRQQADRYRMDLSVAAAARIREAASLLRYSALERQIGEAAVEPVDLFVSRAEA